MNPPPAIQNAMMTKDKKPFTYTPGGIDLSEIKSPRLGRRIERNANYGGVSDTPQQPQLAQHHDLSQLPPSTLAAMQPQMHVQVLPPGQVPTLPGRQHGAAPPPPPPAPRAPPPPPPMDPLPTQKVVTGDNQVVERPDMTKIIPDNPMALLRKTGGPQPRKVDPFEAQPQPRPQPQYQTTQPHTPPGPQFNHQQQRQYQQPQSPHQRSPPVQQQAIPEPTRYQPAQSPQRNEPLQRNGSQRQPEYKPEVVVRPQPAAPESRPKQFSPPIKVIERQESLKRDEPPVKTSTAHLGSLYIPPVGQQQQQQQVTAAQAPPPHRSNVRAPPSPPEKQHSPEAQQSPGTPTLNKAPRPWENKKNQEELPPWARKEDAPLNDRPQQPQPVQAAQQQPPPRFAQTAPKSPSFQVQHQGGPNQGGERVLRVNIITHDESGNPCSPKAVIYDPVTGIESVQPIYPDEHQQQPSQNQNNSNPNAVFVTQPLVFQHAPAPGQQQRKPVQRGGSLQGQGQGQGATRVIPVQIEGGAARTQPTRQFAQTPATPGGDRSLNRQQSWGNNSPTQSNSFKLIQKMTETEDDEDDYDQPITEHSPKFTQQFQQAPADQFRRMKMNDDDRNLMNKFKQGIEEGRSLHNEEDPRYRGPAIPSKAFKLLQSMTDGYTTSTPPPAACSSVPQNSGTAGKGSQVRTIPIQIEGEPPRKYIPPSEQTVPEPKKYTGSAIPSRSFKILQAMTAPDTCAYANEVSENIIDPTKITYPYPFDPNYPYPPPYWYDPYYNPYHYQYNQSELSSTDTETDERRSNSRENSKTPTNEDEAKKSERRSSARQTPVPFVGYYPPPFVPRPIRTPTTDTESEDESMAPSRRTPLPFWGYPHTPYYPPYTPPPFGEPYRQKEEDAKPEDQCEEATMYPQCPPYWDPYYYPYYYGYHPPVYSPYPFYGYPNEDEMAGYSSTDEMAYYAQRFAQESNNQRRKSQTPRIVVTPTAEVEKSIRKESKINDRKSSFEEDTCVASRNVSNSTLAPKESHEQEEQYNMQTKEQYIETERCPSDSESESEREYEEPRCSSRNQNFNPLHSFKSVTDIAVYTENVESDSSSSEEEDTESVNEENEDAVSVYYVEEDQMPHQLSVIFEESERTDTSRRSQQMRSLSVCSEASTIADRTEEIEDEVCTAVSVMLPMKRKSQDKETEVEADVSVEVTLKSPSLTPKNERSPCRLEDETEEEEIKELLHTESHENKTKTATIDRSKIRDTQHDLLSQMHELENTLNKSSILFNRPKENDNCNAVIDMGIKEERNNGKEPNCYDASISDSSQEDVECHEIPVNEDEVYIHGAMKQDKINVDSTADLTVEDDGVDSNRYLTEEFKLTETVREEEGSHDIITLEENTEEAHDNITEEFRLEIESTEGSNVNIESNDHTEKEDENNDDSLDFWSIIKKDEDEISSKKTRQQYWGQKYYNTVEMDETKEEDEHEDKEGCFESSELQADIGGQNNEEDEENEVVASSSNDNYVDDNVLITEVALTKDTKAEDTYNTVLPYEREDNAILNVTTAEDENIETDSDTTITKCNLHDNEVNEDYQVIDEEDSAGSKNSSCSKSRMSEEKVEENISYRQESDVKIGIRKSYSKEKCNGVIEDTVAYTNETITAVVSANICHDEERSDAVIRTSEETDVIVEVNKSSSTEETKITMEGNNCLSMEEFCSAYGYEQRSSLAEETNQRFSHHYLDTDESSSGSESEAEEEREEGVEETEEMTEEYPQPLSIKERIKALQESVRQKQQMFKRKDEDVKPPVKDKLSTLEVSEAHNVSKTTSTKSSLRSFEELSEEEVDSGVTSDMSRHISDSEEFPELGKMSRYQRAATHSRLFRLLQEDGCEEDEEEEEQEVQKPVDKFSKLSVRRRQQEQEDNSNRKNMLSLPLKKQIDEDVCPEVPPNVNEKLVDELVQSMLRQKKGKIFRSMSMNKVKAAAIKILQEDEETAETPEDLSSFMSPLMTASATSTENSTAAQTPQEFYAANDYKSYYDSWKEEEEDYEILPSKAFKLIQEHAVSNKPGVIAGLLAKCPRILSSKNVNKEMLELLESTEDDPSPIPDTSLERNEVTSAS